MLCSMFCSPHRGGQQPNRSSPANQGTTRRVGKGGRWRKQERYVEEGPERRKSQTATLEGPRTGFRSHELGLKKKNKLMHLLDRSNSNFCLCLLLVVSQPAGSFQVTGWYHATLLGIPSNEIMRLFVMIPTVTWDIKCTQHNACAWSGRTITHNITTCDGRCSWEVNITPSTLLLAVARFVHIIEYGTAQQAGKTPRNKRSQNTRARATTLPSLSTLLTHNRTFVTQKAIIVVRSFVTPKLDYGSWDCCVSEKEDGV